MAARNPLVVISGLIQELPTGDTVNGAGSGGSGYGAPVWGLGNSETLGSSHNGKLLMFDQSRLNLYLNGDWSVQTSTLAVTLGSAATLGSGWWCDLVVDGSNPLAVTASGTDKIDPVWAQNNADNPSAPAMWTNGVSSGSVVPRMIVRVVCDGARFFTFKRSGSTHLAVLTSGTSWVTPLGVRTGIVELQGGGGSGGKSNSVSLNGGGGAAGAYVKSTISLTPGAAVTYAVGAGGAAQTVANTGGNAGGATSMTGVNVANGGAGGGTSWTIQPVGASAPATTSSLLGVSGGPAYAGTSTTNSFGGTSQYGRGSFRAGTTTAAAASGYGSGGVGAISTAGTDSTAGMPGVIVITY